MQVLTTGDLAAGVERLVQDAAGGSSRTPLLVVDLDRAGIHRAADGRGLDRAAEVLDRAGGPAIGVTGDPWSPAAARLGPHLDLTLTGQPDPPRFAVTVADPGSAAERIGRAVNDSPSAATILCQVLRRTESLCVADALTMESLAYSVLLAGPEFGRWRARTPRREAPPATPPVRLTRAGGRLTVTLDHPARRNAFGQPMRESLAEALELIALDPTIHEASLEGAGPVFSSGGDLDEFGVATDVAVAHLARLERHPGALLHRVADRVVARLHGRCIGAGIEIPAFAGRVLVSPDVGIRLPELAMGLIPGAGGTVSLPRRIGRWRTAYLALTGEQVTGTTALQWGLADGLTAPSGEDPGA